MAQLSSTDAVAAWRSLLETFTDIRDVLAEELQDAEGIELEHYEVLLMLYEAGSDGIRPSDLADKRRVSRSGITRLVDKLETQDIVERNDCGDDGRGRVLVLGREGKRLFARAGRVHLDGIERHVGQRLTSTDMADLQRILAKLGETPQT